MFFDSCNQIAILKFMQSVIVVVILAINRPPAPIYRYESYGRYYCTAALDPQISLLETLFSCSFEHRTLDFVVALYAFGIMVIMLRREANEVAGEIYGYKNAPPGTNALVDLLLMQMDICSHIGFPVNDVNSLHSFCTDTLQPSYGFMGDF
ncbi:hypothetical protein L1987_10243 [Smallanthus sonchifolius]|uniref:Uncharacterized protein n=1 Tax=Smallanthus sonchifolius TaxID=185202 RepID=A0ACB9JRW7_9ASTR|nr:hypothetical protein L1987_10243 [Smallanthus sonchifolius]